MSEWTEVERRHAEFTRWGAEPGEHVISTACPECRTRFVMLARRTGDGQDVDLRCTKCRWQGEGTLAGG